MFGLADREAFSIEYLIANIATGLLLLGNRLAFAQWQLTSAKEPRPAALTPQTRPSIKTNWRCQANNIPNMAISKFTS